MLLSDRRDHYPEPAASGEVDLAICNDISLGSTASLVSNHAECLSQLLEAFRDIADRDDIHQAAERLRLVQEWICRDAAAADPIFSCNSVATSQ